MMMSTYTPDLSFLDPPEHVPDMVHRDLSRRIDGIPAITYADWVKQFNDKIDNGKNLMEISDAEREQWRSEGIRRRREAARRGEEQRKEQRQATMKYYCVETQKQFSDYRQIVKWLLVQTGRSFSVATLREAVHSHYRLAGKYRICCVGQKPRPSEHRNRPVRNMMTGQMFDTRTDAVRWVIDHQLVQHMARTALN